MEKSNLRSNRVQVPVGINRIGSSWVLLLQKKLQLPDSLHLLIHNFRSSHQNTWSLLDTRICWFCLYTLWIVYKCRGEPDSCSYLSHHNSLLKYRTHFYIISTSIGEILVSFASISIFLNVLYSYWLIYMYIIWNIPSSSCLKIGTHIVVFYLMKSFFI